MSQLWTISDSGTGGVVCPCFATPSFGSHPKDNGWPWDATTQSATRVNDQPDEAVDRWNGSAWEPDLTKLKVRKAEAVNALRLEAGATGCDTPFGVVDCDQRSCALIQGAALMALIAKMNDQPFAESWTMHDNSQVALDADGMIAMGAAVGAFVSAAHARGVELKEAIAAADDATAIAEIDITEGWPS